MSVEILALLALLPIIVLFILLVWIKVPTHWAAVIGWVVTVAVALIFFNTSLEVSMLASLSGVVSSLGITLLIAVAVFQIAFMEETGAIARITAFIKSLAPDDKAAQTMIVGNGAGTTLVSIGATPVAILPPIFKGLGYSDFLAIALPAIGFLGLDAYGMLGICMVAVSDIIGISVIEINKMVVLFLPIVSTLCAFTMLYLMDKWQGVKNGWAPALIAGLSGSIVCILIAYIPFLQGAVLLSGIIGGIVVMGAELLYLKLRGYRLFDEEKLNDDDRASMKVMGLGKALSPWILMVIFLCATNFIPPLYDFLANTLACPVEILPNTIVKTRPLWNAYTWALVATLLSFLIIRPTGAQMSSTLKKFGKSAPKPMIAVCLFYAIGILMTKTGVDPAAGWVVADSMNNMITVMAEASVNLFGVFLPIISIPLVVLGAFITSSQTSSCVMFSSYFVAGASALSMNPVVMIGMAVIVGGVAGLISPAKLLNAAAVIGADGEDEVVLAKVLVPAIILFVIMAILCFVACLIIPAGAGV